MKFDAKSPLGLEIEVQKGKGGLFWIAINTLDSAVGTKLSFQTPLGPYETEDEAFAAAQILLEDR